MPAQPQDAAGRRLRREMHCSHEIAKAQMAGEVIVCRLPDIGRRFGGIRMIGFGAWTPRMAVFRRNAVMRGLRLFRAGRKPCAKYAFAACLFAEANAAGFAALFRLRLNTLGLPRYFACGSIRSALPRYVLASLRAYARLARLCSRRRCARLASIRRASGSFGLAGRNARKCGEIQNS